MDRQTVLVFVACLAIAGISVGLWIPLSDPCVEIAWVVPRSIEPDMNNPYGMQICDYFPTNPERYAKLAVVSLALLLPAAIIGAVASRFALLLGGAAASLGCLFAATFWSLVPTYNYVPAIGLSMLVPTVIAFGIGMLGAFLGRRAMPNTSLERTLDR